MASRAASSTRAVVLHLRLQPPWIFTGTCDAGAKHIHRARRLGSAQRFAFVDMADIASRSLRASRLKLPAHAYASAQPTRRAGSRAVNPVAAPAAVVRFLRATRRRTT